MSVLGTLLLGEMEEYVCPIDFLFVLSLFKTSCSRSGRGFLEVVWPAYKKKLLILSFIKRFSVRLICWLQKMCQVHYFYWIRASARVLSLLSPRISSANTATFKSAFPIDKVMWPAKHFFFFVERFLIVSVFLPFLYLESRFYSCCTWHFFSSQRKTHKSRHMPAKLHVFIKRTPTGLNPNHLEVIKSYL